MPDEVAHLDVVAPAVVDAYVLTVKAGSLSATAGDGLGRVTATVDAGSLLVDLAAASGMKAVCDAWLPPMIHPARAHDPSVAKSSNPAPHNVTGTARRTKKFESS